MSSTDESKNLRVARLSEELEAKILQSIGREIKGGNPAAILHGLRLCFTLKITPPSWLTDAFCRRVKKAADSYESWEPVFGRPHKKGRKKAGRELEKHAVLIWLKICELRASGMRGDEVYRRAAVDLNIHRDWQTVRDAYYRSRGWHSFLKHAVESVEAMERAQIRDPETGEVKVSSDEFERWMADWFQAHPMPPLLQSSSEKRPKIKRKIG